MSNDGASLLTTITRLIDNNTNDNAGLDNLVTVLSLICLLCVFTRGQGGGAAQPQAAPQGAGAKDGLNKILGDLMKGGSSGVGPEALMSLLPLLNNPQLKSKLNPATIGSVLSMLNGMGGTASDKQDASKEKVKEETKDIIKETIKETNNEERHLPTENFDDASASEEQEEKSLGRYLNWKTNF